MYKLCKTEQSMARQRELEQGLLQAMLNQPYDEISVSDLCDQMNIPRKSFYRYFSGKQGALFALIDHTVDEYDNLSVADNSRNTVTHKQELANYLRFWKQQKPLLDALVKNGLEGVLVMRAVDHGIEDLSCPNRVASRDSEIAQAHAMSFAVCGLLVMILRWYRDGFNVSVEQMAEIAADLTTKPLFGPEFD